MTLRGRISSSESKRGKMTSSSSLGSPSMSQPVMVGDLGTTGLATAFKSSEVAPEGCWLYVICSIDVLICVDRLTYVMIASVVKEKENRYCHLSSRSSLIQSHTT